MRLKLFVWEHFAPDYKDGLAFAIAKTEAEARDFIIKKMGYEVGTWGPVSVYPVNTPIGFSVSGSE